LENKAAASARRWVKRAAGATDALEAVRRAAGAAGATRAIVWEAKVQDMM
jgi:hypothetical protein